MLIAQNTENIKMKKAENVVERNINVKNDDLIEATNAPSMPRMITIAKVMDASSG
ncbi:MAG: hypothetical protein LBF40_10970 [Deltaproteobacteria bacterium]|jgi:hypothetical protein|nr:hypothetical protein [Deltaproteobacteria bacterium]